MSALRKPFMVSRTSFASSFWAILAREESNLPTTMFGGSHLYSPQSKLNLDVVISEEVRGIHGIAENWHSVPRALAGLQAGPH